MMISKVFLHTKIRSHALENQIKYYTKTAYKLKKKQQKI